MLFCRSLNASIGYGFAMESDVNERRSAADVKRVEGASWSLMLAVGDPQLARERGKLVCEDARRGKFLSAFGRYIVGDAG